MKIIIRETEGQQELNIYDARTGVNWIMDLLGNADALLDGQFDWDEDLDAWVCDQDTWDWWCRVVREYQEADDRIQEMREEYGYERIDQLTHSVHYNDLEDWPGAVNASLDKFLEDIEGAEDEDA